MLNLGQTNNLIAFRRTENGIYLVDEDLNEVLLPNKYIPEGFELDDKIEVFLYKDSEDRIIATTLVPKIKLNGYAALEAKMIGRFGAFFEWGLEKDLLVPYGQQAQKIEEGKSYVVYLYLDEVSQRLVGTTKISGTLEKDSVELSVGDKVEMTPYEETDIGFSTIVNEKYQGMLFKNEIFDTINIGNRMTGYVKKIRDDYKVDLSLQRFGYRAVDDNVEKLHQILLDHNGYLALNDKSSPESISKQLGMSKKVFKKSVGALYKQKRIEITEDGIRIKENSGGD